MDQELGQASRFVMVSIDGVDWQVPADTSLLNCFQYLQAYAISMGGFCWNDDCHTCEVLVQKGSGISERVLACQTQVTANMTVLEMTDKLRFCLRGLTVSP